MNSVKKNIIIKGAGVIHHNGFNNTGISEILTIANIPKGSFYFYFKNKEDFGMEVIKFYTKELFFILEKNLKNIYNSPIENLKNFFTEYFDYLEKIEKNNGCPIYNLAQEMSLLNENMRQKLMEVLSELQKQISLIIRDAQNRSNIRLSINEEEGASFILSTWAGSLIEVKVKKSNKAFTVFKQNIFDTFLKPETINPVEIVEVEKINTLFEKKSKLAFLRRK